MSNIWHVQIVFKDKATHVVVLVLTHVQGEHEHPTPFCEVTALTNVFDRQNHFHRPHMCNLKIEKRVHFLLRLHLIRSKWFQRLNL